MPAVVARAIDSRRPHICAARLRADSVRLRARGPRPLEPPRWHARAWAGVRAVLTNPWVADRVPPGRYWRRARLLLRSGCPTGVDLDYPWLGDSRHTLAPDVARSSLVCVAIRHVPEDVRRDRRRDSGPPVAVLLGADAAPRRRAERHYRARFVVRQEPWRKGAETAGHAAGRLTPGDGRGS